MKTNYIPAIVMLLAGAVYCLFGIRAQVSLEDFLIQLLIVLLVFYILGGIIRMILDKFMGDVAVKTTTEENETATETEGEKSEEEENASENETEA